MASLVFECPHCRAEKIGFAGRAAYPRRPGESEIILILQCEGCGEAIIANVHGALGQATQWVTGHAHIPGQIWQTYPKPTALKCPPDVPPNVRTAYLSGLDNLGRKGGANAAAIMFRRSVEIATKIVNPDAARGDNLKKRISALPDDIATPAMKEWAQHIRLEANDAAHEPEEYSDKDAAQLHIFAEMFLTYAFTLPKMLEKAKEPPAPPPPPRPA